MPELLNLPNELLILIGHNLADPSDLLALRLTHSLFDSLFAARFTSIYHGQDYMAGVSPDCEVVIIDTQLVWAAQNNHLHFASSLMRKVNLGEDSGRGRVRLMACFLGLQNEGLRSAVRNGYTQMLELLLRFIAERAPGNLEAAWKECWEVTLKEENAEMAMWVLKEGSPWEAEDEVNSAMKMAREAEMWDVAEFAYGIGHERFGRGWRRRGKGK